MLFAAPRHSLLAWAIAVLLAVMAEAWAESMGRGVRVCVPCLGLHGVFVL